MQRPYVIISTAMSLDGYIDDATEERLVLSNTKDLDRVNALRETCDGILVGANTVRKDNPKLLSKTGKKLTKITITSSGTIDSTSNFLTTGDSEKIVYTLNSQTEKLSKKLASLAVVVGVGEKHIDIEAVLSDLYKRGIKRLLVEGGSTVLTQFFEKGWVDELHLAIAGFFVGDKNAPRFVNTGAFHWNKDQRLRLVSVTSLDNIAVLQYKV